MVSIDDSVVHFVVKSAYFVDISDVSEDGVALIANGDQVESSEEEKVQRIKNDKGT